jgi:hypothetical protein
MLGHRFKFGSASPTMGPWVTHFLSLPLFLHPILIPKGREELCAWHTVTHRKHWLLVIRPIWRLSTPELRPTAIFIEVTPDLGLCPIQPGVPRTILVLMKLPFLGSSVFLDKLGWLITLSAGPPCGCKQTLS